MFSMIERRRPERRDDLRLENERRRARAFYQDGMLVWVRDRLPIGLAHANGWNEQRCASCRDPVLVWDDARVEAPPTFFCPDCLDRATPPDAFEELGVAG